MKECVIPSNTDNLPEWPKRWAWARLEEICSNEKTKGPIGSVPYLEIGDIDISTKKYALGEKPSVAGALLSEKGDILVSRVRPTRGAITIAKDEHLSVSSALTVLRPCAGLPSEYIHFYLAWNRELLTFLGENSTGTMYPTIKEDFVIRYKIPLAPLPEQHRIVAKIEELFTRLDAGVEALKKIKLQLKRYRQSVLKFALEGKLTADWREAYQGKLEPASVLLEKIKGERKKKGLGKHRELPLVDTSVLPAIPKTWVWTQAEYICDFITKGTTPTAKELFKGVGDIPFIKVYNLTNYGALDFDLNPTFISFKTHSHELARSKIFPGDVLMNIVGPPLGKVSIVPTLYPEWNTNQAIAIFRPLPGYDRKLLCFSLLTGSILLWAQHRAKATAGQFNLTLEICRALPLPLPPVAEQHEVVEEIERHLFIADEIEMIVEQSLTQSERLRQSIMKKAFEGKLVPQDPNDEPAEKLLERIRQERARQQAEHKPAKSGRNKSNTKQMRLV